MDLLQAYADGSDSDDPTGESDLENEVNGSGSEKKNVGSPVEYRMFNVINSAPSVEIDLKHGELCIDPAIKEIKYNPTADALWRPVQGPAHPEKGSLGLRQGRVQNCVTGYVEDCHIDQFAFDEQYHTFQQFGYSMDPSVTAGVGKLIGDESQIKQHNGQTVSVIPRKPPTSEQLELRKKRKTLSGDIHDPETYMGPWATYFFEEEEEFDEPNEEQKEYVAMQAAKHAKKKRQEMKPAEEFSTFHGEQLKDYLGRSYIHPPSHLKNNKKTVSSFFTPKKEIHRWSGHNKGISAIRWFPKSAHLMLSCSIDATVKIWNVYGNRKLLRTYCGHHGAVRDISFNHDGTRFISCSYDRYVKLWDTETGQCISHHTTGKVPFVVKFHPQENHANEFLCGQSNKRIMQWDTRDNKITQEYNEHLGPINAILFIDNNRRFLTTSDDKKVLVWEYGIPVVVKHISEPDMHSMPSVALHPNGRYFLGQSQDNRILVYSASGRFKLNTKKSFVGHLSSGYACQIDFSPDGKYVISGDAEGRCFFWDWRSCRIYRKLKCHDEVCIGAMWHPFETSKVATCSWDGTIKYWD